MSKAKDDLIAEIPWVRLYKGKQKPCEGIKWKHVALKHLYTMGGKPPLGIPDKARCKFRAKWHYTAPRPRKYEPASKTGDYCIHHLFSLIYSYQRDYERYVQWRRANKDPELEQDPEGRYEEPYTGALPEDQG